jgi:hypothetical protein
VIIVAQYQMVLCLVVTANAAPRTLPWSHPLVW